MNVEKTIVEMHGMLVKIMDKQDEHGRILNEHTEILNDHGRLLNEHSEMLHEHSKMLQEHNETLQEHGKVQGQHGQILENHSSQFSKHGQILRAIRSGQEHLKAELDGMKISNAKEIGELKEENETLAINQELLRNETWTSKVDVERIKKTLGMA